jgi:hypothetical protein
MAPPSSVLEGPTVRPGEPVQAGIGGPVAPAYDDGLFEMRQLARNYPYPDVQDMLSILQALNAAELRPE